MGIAGKLVAHSRMQNLNCLLEGPGAERMRGSCESRELALIASRTVQGLLVCRIWAFAALMPHASSSSGLPHKLAGPLSSDTLRTIIMTSVVITGLASTNAFPLAL